MLRLVAVILLVLQPVATLALCEGDVGWPLVRTRACGRE